MDHNVSLIKALVTTLQMEVEALGDRDDGTGEIEESLYHPVDLSKMLREYETKLIRAALLRTGGNQRRAATLLNLKRSTLNTKIKQFGITILRHSDEVVFEANTH